jgi:hypothetical protein
VVSVPYYLLTPKYTYVKPAPPHEIPVTPLEVAERLCVTESQVLEAFDQANKAAKELD